MFEKITLPASSAERRVKHRTAGVFPQLLDALSAVRAYFEKLRQATQERVRVTGHTIKAAFTDNIRANFMTIMSVPQPRITRTSDFDSVFVISTRGGGGDRIQGVRGTGTPHKHLIRGRGGSSN